MFCIAAITHAAAPLHAGDGNGVALAEVVDVSDLPTRLEYADGLTEGVVVSARDHNAVDARAMNVPDEFSQEIPIRDNTLSLMKKHTCFSAISMQSIAWMGLLQK